MLRHLDVCAGIGGFALGFQWAGLSEPVGFIDINPRCQKVLAKNFPGVPIFGDVRDPSLPQTLPAFDILSAGYPCQPFSLAGQRKGQHDGRHVWPDIFHLIQCRRPSWVVLENVYGHVSLGLDSVLDDLEIEGYATASFIVPALAVGAPHERKRVWVVAHTERGQRREEPHRGASRRVGRVEQPVSWDTPWQSALCKFRGVDDGLSYRVDRVDHLRNAIVPQIAQRIGYAIRQANASSIETLAAE